jgi:hypothetical protein
MFRRFWEAFWAIVIFRLVLGVWLRFSISTHPHFLNSWNDGDKSFTTPLKNSQICEKWV